MQEGCDGKNHAGSSYHSSVRRVHIDVLVDDIPAVEGVLPLHGLSILLSIEYEEGITRRILFDTGPYGSVLLKNAETLEVELEPDVVFGSLHHFHHIGALRNSFPKTPRVLPPPPLARAGRPVSQLQGFPDVYVLAGDSYWNEQGLALKTPRGWLVVVGCSVHGLRRTFGARLLGLGRVWGLIGGFNISTRDVFNLAFMKKLAQRGLELVLPLHSTSMEARKTILERFNSYDFGYEVSGCGVQADVEF